MKHSKNPAHKASNDSAEEPTATMAGEDSTTAVTEHPAAQQVTQGNIPTSKPPVSEYNQGQGLEASMWNPKNKKQPFQSQPRRSRGTSIRRPFRFESLTLGQEDVFAEGARSVAGAPSAGSGQTPSNETRNEWFAALASTVQPLGGGVHGEGQGTWTEDPHQLIPGLVESVAPKDGGSGYDQWVASAGSLLDDIGDGSDINIPILTAKFAPLQTSEVSPIQPATSASMPTAKTLSSEAAESTPIPVTETISGQPAESLAVQSAETTSVKAIEKEPKSVSIKEGIEKVVGDVASLEKKNQGYGHDGDSKGAPGNVDDAAGVREGGEHDGDAEMTVRLLSFHSSITLLTD